MGTYYALDLGGTNFRVLRVQLGGRLSSILSKDVELQPIPQHLIRSTSEVTEFVLPKLYFLGHALTWGKKIIVY